MVHHKMYCMKKQNKLRAKLALKKTNIALLLGKDSTINAEAIKGGATITETCQICPPRTKDFKCPTNTLPLTAC